MTQQAARIRQEMRTPRAAAVAGILFSLLGITSFLLFRISIPPNPLSQPTGMIHHSKAISLALYLLPFAGIAFLWFMGVIRDRLGEYEDRFFATVFLGSGLLFVAMIFTGAAEVAGIITVLGHDPAGLIQSGSYYLGRAEAYQTMNIYAAKMAGVFMMATCTITLQTRTLPRWIALLGHALALILLLSIGRLEWLFLLFPLWVLLISGYMLMEDLRGTARPS
jgi:hypothetical protein